MATQMNAKQVKKWKIVSLVYWMIGLMLPIFMVSRKPALVHASVIVAACMLVSAVGILTWFYWRRRAS